MVGSENFLVLFAICCISPPVMVTSTILDGHGQEAKPLVAEAEVESRVSLDWHRSMPALH